MAKLHFLEFFRKHNGQNVDVDGYPKSNPFQCVDLMRKYCEEVLGIGIYALPPGNAKDIFYNTPSTHRYFRKTVNMPWNAPKQGDIIVWKEPFGPYIENGVRKWAGHVAIVNEATNKRFTSFEQNMPPDLKCRLVEHDNYRGVIGWMTFRGK